jgi:tRNA nucleotidyltransferase (CCA-adding enzyme)
LDRQGKWLLRRFEELNVSRETIKPLVLGRDLIGLGVQPGPAMGKVLKRLYGMQLDNAFETKAQGIQVAEGLIKGKKI